MLMTCIAVIKAFSQSKAAVNESVSADKTTLPHTDFLGEKKLIRDMKSIKSLQQSGISGVFTGQAVSSIGRLSSNAAW